MAAPPDDRGGGSRVVIVVAITGLLATLGAAALSGYWANASAERQFYSQRDAQLHDQRQQTYVDFLRTIAELCLALQNQDKAKAEKELIALLTQESRAALVASKDVLDAITKYTNSVIEEVNGESSNGQGGCTKLLPLRSSFLTVAKRELEGE